MAEYFYSKQEAERFVRESTEGRPVLFARIRLHGNEQWIVDYQRRDLGRSIEILENLNHEVDAIILASSGTAHDGIKKVVKVQQEFASEASGGAAENTFTKLVGLEIMARDLGKMSWLEATKACQAMGGGWRLPTRHELTTLYENRGAIGGFADDYYWTSSPYASTSVWLRSFQNGREETCCNDCNNGFSVRALRTCSTVREKIIPPTPKSDDGKIRFQCPTCAKRLSAPKEFAGKQGKCPTCRTLTRIPSYAADSQKPPTEHVPTDSDPSTFECPGCHKASSHRRESDQYAGDLWVCPSCGYKTVRRSGM